MPGIYDTGIFDTVIFDTPKIQNDADEFATLIVSGVLANTLRAESWSNRLTGLYEHDFGLLFDTGIFDTGIYSHIEFRSPFPTLTATHPRDNVLIAELIYE